MNGFNYMKNKILVISGVIRGIGKVILYCFV